jgi:cell division protein FtsQ
LNPDMKPADDLTLTDGFDPDEVLPYRRQKSVQVRRGGRRGLRALLSALILLLLGAPAAAGGLLIADFALGAREFALNSADDVTIEGNYYVTTDEIRTALGVSAEDRPAKGRNMFRISLDRARREIEAIPWVRTSVIRRAYPHQLIVAVTERAPVAFVIVEGRIKLVDADGVLVERPEKATFTFPVVTGLETAMTPPERKARLLLYQRFLEELQGTIGPSGWELSEVDLSDPDDLQAIMVRQGRTIQLLFGEGDFQPRFQKFLAVLADTRAGEDGVYSMDLRYRNQVVVNPQPLTSAGGSGDNTDTQKPPGGISYNRPIWQRD